VVHIGARCSTVKRFDGIDMLIPNSMFLEKSVTNWTRSDPFLRFTVTVGVAYGSPTRRVQEILEQLVNEDPKVLKYPEPRVFFEEFGDSSLVFTVYFWMAIKAEADYRILAGEMRHKIDDIFRKEGITIAFPQRDVHLDSLSPVQVEIVDGASARARGKGDQGGGRTV
ncbi:MAG: mechanosensitive ion channel, partial [Deltaproteobacteria bacterium]|nr:mechanosensitive ion channel [Deltaproteobacteria bacterium]